MKSTMTALGLALTAALAIGALAASTASAAGEGMLTSTDEQPITLTGTEDGVNFLEAFGEKLECPDSAYTGHATLTKAQTGEGAKHEPLAHGAKSVTVTPHYKQTDGETANCNVESGESTFSITIAMNGCDYDFYDFTTIEAGKYSFKTDIVCPEGNQIVVDTYAGHGHGFQVCETTIPPQTGLEGGEATNQESEGNHTITLTGTIAGISMSRSGLCGSSEEEGAKYQLNVKVEADDVEGNPTDGVTLSHTGKC